MIERLGSAAMAPISSAEVYEIEAGYVNPCEFSHGTVARARAVVIKLTDSDGVFGWGEANPLQPFTAESPADTMRVLIDTLLPTVLESYSPEPGRIDARLDALLPGHLCAKGAIAMALLDLLGNRLGVSVATLLGGVLRSSLPVMWPLGHGAAKDDFAVIEERAAEGYTTFELQMGISPVQDDVDRVAHLEARYGDRFKLIADANQGWSRDQAQEFLSADATSRLAFVEQPLRKNDLEGLSILASSSKRPLSVDESVTGLGQAARFVRLGPGNVFNIKSSKFGGPLRAQRIATVAEAFGLRCFMDSMMEFGITQAASLQHAVTVRNLLSIGHAFNSPLRLAEDPTDFSTLVSKGVVCLPPGPGLGIHVDELHVRRMAVASFRLVSSW